VVVAIVDVKDGNMDESLLGGVLLVDCIVGIKVKVGDKEVGIAVG